MKCTDCEFWDSEKTPNLSKKHRGPSERIDYCLCMKAIMSWDDESSPMLVEDGSMYMAELFTHKDHSCQCFVERITNE